MKNLILFSVFLFISARSFAQAPPIQWEKSYGGSGTDDATQIQHTSDGGYIIAGISASNDGNVTGNHGNSDCWIVKINDTGGIQWQKSYGGSAYDGANSIQQTTDGGYIFAGHASSTDMEVTGSHGGGDYWVVKIDDTGAIQWQKALGGSATEDAYFIQQTFEGGYIVAGSSNSTDGDVTGNHGQQDYWIVKLTATGSITWQKSFGGTGYDQAYYVQQTRDSGYVVAGWTTSTDGDITVNHGNADYWIVKLTPSGSMVWQKSLGGSTSDAATAIQQTLDGGYIAVGWSDSPNDGDVTGNHGIRDNWVVKLTAAGGITWEKSFGGSNNDIGFSVLQTADTGYIIGGWNSSTDGDVTGNHGFADYWVNKLSSTGSLIWQKSLGGSFGEQANSIQITDDGGYIVAGWGNSPDGDVTGNHGADDYWIVKLNCNISAGTISGPATVCTTTNITLTDTASGGVWTSSNGHATVSGGVVTGVSVGVDTIWYSKTTSCGSVVTSFPITVISCPTEVNAINNTPITIVPNPTTGNISIVGASNTSIKVCNTIGQQLKEATNTNTISMSGLPAGLYFVSVFDKHGLLIKQEKVIKE